MTGQLSTVHHVGGAALDSGYLKVPNDLIRSSMPAIHKAVLLWLASQAEGWQFRIGAMSDDLGLGRNTVTRTLSALARGPYLGRQEIGRDDRGNPVHRYSLNLAVHQSGALSAPEQSTAAHHSGAPKKTNEEDQQNMLLPADALKDAATRERPDLTVAQVAGALDRFAATTDGDRRSMPHWRSSWLAFLQKAAWPEPKPKLGHIPNLVPDDELANLDFG